MECSALCHSIVRDPLDIVDQSEHLPLRIDFGFAPKRERPTPISVDEHRFDDGDALV